MIIQYNNIFLNPNQITTIVQGLGKSTVNFSCGKIMECEKVSADDVAREINLLSEQYLESPEIKKKKERDKRYKQKKKKERDEIYKQKVKELKVAILGMQANDAINEIYGWIPSDILKKDKYPYLSLRGYNILKHYDISFSELTKMKPSDLLKIPNLGRKTLNEISYALRAIGVNLESNVTY